MLDHILNLDQKGFYVQYIMKYININTTKLMFYHNCDFVLF